MSKDTLEKLLEHIGKAPNDKTIFDDREDLINQLWQVKREKDEDDRIFIQAITDPENQPSQFGTVPLEWYENLENKLEKIIFNVGEVIDSLDGSYEKHVIRKALQDAIE